MSFASAQPVRAPAPVSGVRFASRTRLTGFQSAALILTPPLQMAAFRQSIIGWEASVLIGDDEDAGKLMLTVLRPEDGALHAWKMAPPSGLLPIEALVKGAAIIRLTAFSPDALPSTPCDVLSCGSNSLLLALPPCVRPTRSAAVGRPLNGASTHREGPLQ